MVFRESKYIFHNLAYVLIHISDGFRTERCWWLVKMSYCLRTGPEQHRAPFYNGVKMYCDWLWFIIISITLLWILKQNKKTRVVTKPALLSLMAKQQLCRHLWHSRLSLWQPPQPPMVTNLASWWLSMSVIIFNCIGTLVYVIFQDVMAATILTFTLNVAFVSDAHMCRKTGL